MSHDELRARESIIDTQGVRHLARLARIALSNDELASFHDQLAAVIDYNIDKLSEIDVAAVEPTSQTTGLTNVWQDDVPLPGLTQSTALSNAPQARSGYFVVRRVMGEM